MSAATPPKKEFAPNRPRCHRVGPVQQTKEQRNVGERKVTALPSPHRLRDTFASAAHEGGVDWYDWRDALR